jgi:hypothetical protein
MAISRMQQPRQMYQEGGIMPRQMYGLGSLVKSIGKSVKSFVKSDLGKTALLGAAAFGIPGTSMGGLFGRASFMTPGGVGVKGLLGKTGIAAALPSFFGIPGGAPGKGTSGLVGKAFNFLKTPGGAFAGITAASALAAAGIDPENPNEMPRNTEALKSYLRQGYLTLNPQAQPDEVEEFVEANTVEYRANGGRIGFAEGMLSFEEAKAMNPGMFSAEVETDVVRPNTELLNYIKRIRDATEKGIIPMDFAMDLIKQKTMEQGVDLQDLRDDIMETQRIEQAYGGRLGYQIGGLSSLYGSNTGGQKPIYPRISDIEASLSGAEQRIGDPSLSSFGASSGGVSDGGFGSPMGGVYNQPTGGEQPNSSNVQTQIPRDPGGEMGMPGFYIPRYDLPKSVLINPIRQPGIQQPGIQQPVRPLSGIGGIQMPQADPNRDYGFNQYGFDSDLLNYLNQQKQGSFSDAGISYNYDPTNQMFSGGTFGAQYGNIPLSVLQQVASGDRNLLQQYQTGGRGAFGGGRGGAAYGGRIGYAFGNPEQNAINASGIMNLPLNQNPAGVTELDLRDSGGFIPPVGVKEKADDIPAMLSNNEFVFTADAVRGMGDGNVNKGAQRMYDMMKKLENGGRV